MISVDSVEAILLIFLILLNQRLMNLKLSQILWFTYSWTFFNMENPDFKYVFHFTDGDQDEVPLTHHKESKLSQQEWSDIRCLGHPGH